MNSPLVSHTEISPNRTTPRNHKIDTITIHCTAGHINVRALGKLFSAKGRMASSNYGIDDLGHIALYVDEADRSWCSSNAANDNRAVTIEVSSDDTAPYAVTAEAFQASSTWSPTSASVTASRVPLVPRQGPGRPRGQRRRTHPEHDTPQVVQEQGLPRPVPGRTHVRNRRQGQRTTVKESKDERNPDEHPP